MPGKKKSAKKKAVKKSVKKRMGGGMMGPKKKRAGGGMMGPKKKRAGGGMMGPKKKMARGGTVKRMGGGMMGPKKKMAKGGLTNLARKPSGRPTVDDIKRAMPTGRSAAAKKAAMKGVKTKSGAFLASLKKGKGNPAGKDLSIKGKLTALVRAAPQKGRRGGKGLGRLMRKGAGKKK
jgi:hypothetical protein